MTETVIPDWFSNTATKIRDSLELLSPADTAHNAILIGLVLLAGGLLVGVFGAQYARWFLSLLLAGAGFLFGAKVADHFGFPIPAGGLAGFIALAIICYFSFRFWVGLAVGLLLSAVGLFAYGNDTIWPEFISYSEMSSVAELPDQTDLAVSSGFEPGRYLLPKFRAHLRGFYDYFKSNQPQRSSYALGIAALCLVLGFILGACYTRWALILSCAVLATSMLSASLTAFAERFASPAWEARLSQHPLGTLGFIICCFLLSTLVQYRITQPQSPPPEPEEKPK